MLSDKVGHRLRLLREREDFSRENLAELFGKVATAISRYETGASEMDYRALVTLREKFNVDLNWLLTGDGEEPAHYHDGAGRRVLSDDFIHIPLVPQKVSAGRGQEQYEAIWTANEETKTEVQLFIEDGLRDGNHIQGRRKNNEIKARNTARQKIIDELPLVPVPRRLAYGGEVYALEVRGDSMTGVQIFDGDIVFYAKDEVRGDGIYVIEVNGELFVKRLQFDPFSQTVTIHSENPRYPSRSEPVDSQAMKINGKVRGWIHAHPY